MNDSTHIFLRCLWKEWRDQRAIVLGIAVALPLVLGVCGLALPTAALASPLFPSTAAFACYLVGVLAIAAEVVPGERRRGTLALLRRLPAGLAAPFRAKMLFAVAALALLAVSGYGAAAVAGRAFAGVWPGFEPRLSWLVPVAAAAGAWVFVVSCWLPRGALAVPATAAVLGLGLLPVHVVVEANPWIVPRDGPPLWPAWLFAAAAPPVAWISFVRGQRIARGAFAGAWRGLLVTLVLFTPVWGYTAHAARTAGHFRFDGPVQILTGVVGSDLRHAYLDVRRAGEESVSHVLAVDLETGSWRQVGAPGDSVRRASSWYRRDLRPAPVVGIIDRSRGHRNSPGQGRQEWVRWIDAATGETLREEWTSWRASPRGRDDGALSGWIESSPAGLGRHVWREAEGRPGEAGVYDPFRDRVFLRRDLPGGHRFFVRPGRWIVQPSAARQYVLLDPETGERADVPEHVLKHCVAILPDGRALTTDPGTREVVAVDPESGARAGTGLRTAGREHQPGIWGLAGDAAVRTPGGRLLFRVHVATGTRVARLDPRSLTFDFADALATDSPNLHFHLLAVVDDDTILGVRASRELVRVRFSGATGGAPLEVLFPR